MTHKIDKKIVGYKVVTEEKEAPVENFIKEHMHEGIARPERLIGTTYKIKTPDSEHALYMTINNMVLNEGTEHEEIRPYELFINSKNMEHYQWMVALTRVISAVFRKGGDVTFLVEELKAVFDPKGGFFKKGKFVPSLIAELGYTIEQHFLTYGLMEVLELPDHMKEFIEEKKKQLNAKEALLCTKCNSKAVVLMDGCMTCTACGDSKCG